MSLSDTISNTFNDIITNNGTTITNLSTNTEFNGLVTSGDFVAAFTEGDQETELSIQVTMMNEYSPKTGDIIVIENKKYIVQTVQSRANGPITRITAYETRKKVK